VKAISGVFPARFGPIDSTDEVDAAPTSMDPRVRRNVELAAACGVPPAMLLSVALATAAPRTVAQALELVKTWSSALLELTARPSTHLKALAELEPELCFQPDIASVRPEAADHELRGRLLFRELLGRQSFFQIAAWSIAGLALSPADAEYLEHLGVVTQLQDVRIWPLTVTRRAGLGPGGFTHALLGGIATMLNSNMAVQPVGAFMRFLDRLDDGVAAGRTVEEQLGEVLARRERVPGVGRPALGPDERNIHVVKIVQRHGRDRGRSWVLAQQINAFFRQNKAQHINSAGLQGAILRDMGFSPQAASAMCVLYFVVPILAHAVAADEAKQQRTQISGSGTAA
jgi:hypothetical protein